jgi:predicted nuclease of predicted toxin-antitoxin system
MRFLIDTNLPRAVIAAPERVGHQVEFARNIGLEAPNEQIDARARESDAALLTRDTDLADVRRYPPTGKHIDTPARAYRHAVCCDCGGLYGILPYT